MKQVCLLCARTSLDRNLYCQEIYCPAEKSPNVMEYGQWLGDIEIVKPVMVLRSSVLYEARHQKEKVLLKVAHVGQENTERLKREATFLRDMKLKNEPNPYLPIWRPPYASKVGKEDIPAYGRGMLGDHLLYFYMFDHFPGEPLRDVLTKNAQLWINHIGWMMTNLASAVAILQSKGKFHLSLSPDTVLVNFDPKQNIPQIMLFDLGLISDAEGFKQDWYSFAIPPAYTCPELVLNPRASSIGYHSDVYGLGLILYELLVGQPCYTYRLSNDEAVYTAIRNNQRIRMNRMADVEYAANIALRAVNEKSDQRYPNAMEVVNALVQVFDEVPGIKKSRMPSLNTTLTIVIILMGIAFLITFAITLINLF